MFPYVDHASSVVSYPERRDAAHLEAKGPAGTAALCVVPVSYTHLDVYKRQEEMVSISLEELRDLDYPGITRKLMGVSGFQKVVVNAADDLDVEVFVTALMAALNQGKQFLYRCAAGLVRVRCV